MVREGDWEPFDILYMDDKWVMAQMFTVSGGEVEIKILAEVSVVLK